MKPLRYLNLTEINKIYEKGITGRRVRLMRIFRLPYKVLYKQVKE